MMNIIYIYILQFIILIIMAHYYGLELKRKLEDYHKLLKYSV